MLCSNPAKPLRKVPRLRPRVRVWSSTIRPPPTPKPVSLQRLARRDRSPGPSPTRPAPAGRTGETARLAADRGNVARKFDTTSRFLNRSPSNQPDAGTIQDRSRNSVQADRRCSGWRRTQSDAGAIGSSAAIARRPGADAPEFRIAHAGPVRSLPGGGAAVPASRADTTVRRIRSRWPPSTSPTIRARIWARATPCSRPASTSAAPCLWPGPSSSMPGTPSGRLIWWRSSAGPMRSCSGSRVWKRRAQGGDDAIGASIPAGVRLPSDGPKPDEARSAIQTVRNGPAVLHRREPAGGGDPGRFGKRSSCHATRQHK